MESSTSVAWSLPPPTRRPSVDRRAVELRAARAKRRDTLEAMDWLLLPLLPAAATEGGEAAAGGAIGVGAGAAASGAAAAAAGTADSVALASSAAAAGGSATPSTDGGPSTNLVR